MRCPFRNVDVFVVKKACGNNKNDDCCNYLEDGEWRSGYGTHFHEPVVQELCGDDVLRDPTSVTNALLVLEPAFIKKLVVFVL